MQTVCSAVEAAAILDVSPVTVHRWARDGLISHVYKMPGKTGAYVFARAELEDLARDRTIQRHPAGRAS